MVTSIVLWKEEGGGAGKLRGPHTLADARPSSILQIVPVQSRNAVSSLSQFTAREEAQTELIKIVLCHKLGFRWAELSSCIAGRDGQVLTDELFAAHRRISDLGWWQE